MIKRHAQRQRNEHLSNNAYSVDFPSSWQFEKHPECAQLLSPSGVAAVTISTFSVVSAEADTDATHHLSSFVEGKADIQIIRETPHRAEADYRDDDGRLWRVVVVTTPTRMIIGTVNGKGADFKTGQQILESLQPC